MDLTLLESHRRNCRECYELALSAGRNGSNTRAKKFAELAKDSANFIISNSTDKEERKLYRQFLERIDAVAKQAALQKSSNDDCNATIKSNDSVKKFPLVSRTGITFNDIVGLDQAKNDIRAALYPLRYPELARQYKCQAGGFITLYGPAGTGKTTVAKAITTEFDADMIVVRSSDLFSPFVGETEQNIAALFSQVNSSQNFTVVYFDDADTIFTKGNEHETYRASSLNELKSQLDGFSGRPNTLVVLSCNNPEVLDEAILSRSTSKIYVGLPNKMERAKIFELELKGTNADDNVDVEALAEVTSMYSGRNIRNIVDLACKNRLLAVCTAKESGSLCEQTKVCQNDLLDAIKTIKPDVSENDILRYEEIVARISKNN